MLVIAPKAKGIKSVKKLFSLEIVKKPLCIQGHMIINAMLSQRLLWDFIREFHIKIHQIDLNSNFKCIHEKYFGRKSFFNQQKNTRKFNSQNN
ncbi:CLUMA_CG008192, isoform A [Clunio marinus]|uniref:CLUMA_CG008192, isoform A n=1 Tax=Clunio marinus TaxID=568069 RepID=A0A1J1I519_9DIPT|nr:CLUMA_CG008192, isoform A [Clunio marinus]